MNLEDFDLEDFDFDFDEDAEEYYTFYILGDRPIRITVFNETPILAETINFETKTFGIDNSFIKVVVDSLEIRKVDEAAFINQCLKFGITPVESE